ncbi:hypothetical protein JCM10207_008532 [Rhodosporidiobolus poonsookiae]
MSPALANHGYISHTSTVTASEVIQGTEDAFFMGAALSGLLSLIAVTFGGNPSTATFFLGGEDERTCFGPGIESDDSLKLRSGSGDERHTVTGGMSRSTQPYTAVALTDLSQPLLSPASAPAAYLSPLSGAVESARSVQARLDAHPLPDEPRAWAVVVVRALPVLATISWGGTVLWLFLAWIIPARQSYNAAITAVPYVSDRIASNRGVAVIGTILTAVFYVLTLSTERLLRNQRVLVEATEDKWLWTTVGSLDIVAGVAASATLVAFAFLSSSVDQHTQDTLLAVFFICVAVSGGLQTVEVEHLWHEHPDRHDLRDGTILKWLFLGFFIAAACGFHFLRVLCGENGTSTGVDSAGSCYRVTSASALCEWLACLGLLLYLSTLILDLWPLHRHHAVTPPAWADKTGVRGVWLHRAGAGAGEESEKGQEEKVPVRLPTGMGVHRPPVTREGMAGGMRCAVVLPQGQMLPGGGGGASDWFSEGKEAKKSGSRRG